MESRKELERNQVSLPQANFSRSHYRAIEYVLAHIEDAHIRTKIALVFNHYFRGTQENYDSKKFLEACKVETSAA